jgi:hypothetical protein
MVRSPSLSFLFALLHDPKSSASGDLVIDKFRKRYEICIRGESALTCYFRHLGFVFEQAGIVVTKENRKELDCVLRGLVGGDDCPSVWRQIKKRLAEDEAGFVAELKAAWSSRASVKA